MCDGHGGSRCVENVVKAFPKQLGEQLRPILSEDLSPAVLCDQLIHAFDEVEGCCVVLRHCLLRDWGVTRWTAVRSQMVSDCEEIRR